MRKLSIYLAVLGFGFALTGLSNPCYAVGPSGTSWDAASFGTDCSTYGASEVPYNSGLLLKDLLLSGSGQWRNCTTGQQHWGAWWDVTCDIEQYQIMTWGPSGTRIYFHIAGAAPGQMDVDVPGTIQCNCTTGMNYWISFTPTHGGSASQMPLCDNIDGSNYDHVANGPVTIPLEWWVKIGSGGFNQATTGAGHVTFPISTGPINDTMMLKIRIKPTPQQAPGRYFLDAEGYIVPAL